MLNHPTEYTFAYYIVHFNCFFNLFEIKFKFCEFYNVYAKFHIFKNRLLLSSIFAID